MAFKSLQCPYCAGQIDTFDETTRKGFCPFCDQIIHDVQQQQALFEQLTGGSSAPQRSSSHPAADASHYDFEIVGAIMKKYRGSGTNVCVPEGVLAIGEKAFADCTFVSTVTLPDSLKEVQRNAFRGCTRLERINFGSGLETIGETAFINCKSLAEITLPRSCKRIGLNAFQDCKKLSNVTLPRGLDSIEDNAFCSCGITSIKLPPAPLTLGNNVFLECPLKSVYVPKGTKMQYTRSNQVGDPFSARPYDKHGVDQDHWYPANFFGNDDADLEMHPSRIRDIYFESREEMDAYDKAYVSGQVEAVQRVLTSHRNSLDKSISRLGWSHRAKKEELRAQQANCYVSDACIREYYPKLHLISPSEMEEHLADYDFTQEIYDMLAESFLAEYGVDLRENRFSAIRLMDASRTAAEAYNKHGETDVLLENIAQANGQWLTLNYHVGS